MYYLGPLGAECHRQAQNGEQDDICVHPHAPKHVSTIFTDRVRLMCNRPCCVIGSVSGACNYIVTALECLFWRFRLSFVIDSVFGIHSQVKSSQALVDEMGKPLFIFQPVHFVVVSYRWDVHDIRVI